MKPVSALLRFHGGLVCVLGLGCALAPDWLVPPDLRPSLWCRIAGLHLGAMGAYLALLRAPEQPALVRRLMAWRVALGAAEIALGAAQSAPFFVVVGGIDLALSALVVVRLGAVAATTTSEAEAPSRSRLRRAHDLALQGPPVLEGLLGLSAPQLSARFLFGAEAVPVDAWLRFSALHCTYLAVFWWLITRNGAERAIVATTWGRSFVATAFVIYAVTGVAPPRSYLPLLAMGLFFSVGATLWMRRWEDARGLR